MPYWHWWGMRLAIPINYTDSVCSIGPYLPSNLAGWLLDAAFLWYKFFVTIGKKQNFATLISFSDFQYKRPETSSLHCSSCSWMMTDIWTLAWFYLTIQTPVLPLQLIYSWPPDRLSGWKIENQHWSLEPAVVEISILGSLASCFMKSRMIQIKLEFPLKLKKNLDRIGQVAIQQINQ